MKHAMILAGGRATRLGPLAAQLNKALVSYGQKPLLVHQVQKIRSAYPDIEEIHVVVSSRSVDQVRSVIDQSMRHIGIRIDVHVQEDGVDPGDGLLAGLEPIVKVCGDVQLLLVMGDTLIDEIPRVRGNWVATMPTSDERRWCVVDGRMGGSQFTERVLHNEQKHVAVGVYHFISAASLYAATREQEVQRVTCSGMSGAMLMAPILNEYARRQGRFELVEGRGWLDFGDLNAAARARREKFVARDFNSLSLSKYGELTKTSSDDSLRDEIQYMLFVQNTAAEKLFPRLFNVPSDDAYTMEFVDLPTLAELWLYWPGGPGMWADITQELLHSLGTNLWPLAFETPNLEDKCRAMYLGKVHQRWAGWTNPARDWELVRINGTDYTAGQPLLAALGEALEDVYADPNPGVVHGDPNMCNILWSLSSQTFKLLDPRGDFGGGLVGDVRYDVAKYRYSYRWNYPAIAHGLTCTTAFHEEGKHASIYSTHYPECRTAEIDAMDEVIGRYFNLKHLSLIEATLCLSAAPLHHANPQEELALYTAGIIAANQALEEL